MGIGKRVARSERRTCLGAACLLAVVVAGCSSGSPIADIASPPVRDADESVGERGIEVVAKRQGAPPGPGHVWVGWAHNGQVLQDLWRSFGLDGEPPQLSGETVILTATGESSSCPTRLTGATVEGDTLHVSLVDEPAVTPPPDNYTCTADFNPVTFVLRVEGDLVEPGSVVDFGDTEVPLGPAGEVTSEDYGG